MGGITAPVLGSGACPAWMALVPRPQSGAPAGAAPLSLFIKPVDSADATVNSTIVPAFPRRHDGARWALAERAGRSEEHTSELQLLMRTSYAAFCIKKTNITAITQHNTQLP